jgi:hypothetical protein
MRICFKLLSNDAGYDGLLRKFQKLTTQLGREQLESEPAESNRGRESATTRSLLAFQLLTGLEVYFGEPHPGGRPPSRGGSRLFSAFRYKLLYLTYLV